MKTLFYVFLSLAFAFSLQVSALAGGDEVLAKVGNRKITVADFDRFLSSYPPEQQKFLTENPNNKEILLKRMTQVLALSDIARTKGLEKDERIKQQIGYLTNEILAQELIRQEIAKIQVSEDDIKSYYKANMESFNAPEMVKARHILIKVGRAASEEEKNNAREKAEGILKRIKAGEDFAKLAAELSDDPGSKVNGGELGFFPRGRMVKPFEDAAFAMKPGEVSGLVETQFGFHIIKVEEKKPAGIEPFDAVRDKIRAKLTDDISKERTKNLIDTALKDSGVEMHPELLSKAKK